MDVHMRIEDRDDFIDLVAQAVIDKIEERDRITGLVNLVVKKVLELHKEQAQIDQAVAVADEKSAEIA